MAFYMITGNVRFKDGITTGIKDAALVNFEGLSATVFVDKNGTYQFYLPGVGSLDQLRALATTYADLIEEFEVFLCDYTVIDSMTYPTPLG